MKTVSKGMTLLWQPFRDPCAMRLRRNQFWREGFLWFCFFRRIWRGINFWNIAFVCCSQTLERPSDGVAHVWGLWGSCGWMSGGHSKTFACCQKSGRREKSRFSRISSNKKTWWASSDYRSLLDICTRDLWRGRKNMSPIPRKQRRMIRQGISHSLQAKIGGKEFLNEFYFVYSSSLRNLGTLPFPFVFFKHRFHDLGEQCKFFPSCMETKLCSLSLS